MKKYSYCESIYQSSLENQDVVRFKLSKDNFGFACWILNIETQYYDIDGVLTVEVLIKDKKFTSRDSLLNFVAKYEQGNKLISRFYGFD